MSTDDPRADIVFGPASMSGGYFRPDGTYVSYVIEPEGTRRETVDPERGASMRALLGPLLDAAGIAPDPTPSDPERDLAQELQDARDRYGVDSPEAAIAFQRRLAQVRAEEADEPEQWWWLSFAATETDGHNLGVVIVRARGMTGAVARAHAIGANPGGSVEGAPFGDVRDEAWIAAWTDRLISREDALAGVPEPESWG